MTLNGVITVTLRYFNEFGKHTFHHNRRVDLWRNLCTSLLYFVVRVRCRRKESSRSLSRLLMIGFLYDMHGTNRKPIWLSIGTVNAFPLRN